MPSPHPGGRGPQMSRIFCRFISLSGMRGGGGTPPRATAVAVPPAHVPSAAQAAFQPAAQAALEEMEALQAAALEVVAPPQLWLLMAVVCRAGMSQQTVSNM